MLHKAFKINIEFYLTWLGHSAAKVENHQKIKAVSTVLCWWSEVDMQCGD